MHSLDAISAMHSLNPLHLMTSVQLNPLRCTQTHIFPCNPFPSLPDPCLPLQGLCSLPYHIIHHKAFAEQQVCIKVSRHEITFSEVTCVILKSPSPFSTWRGMNWRRVLP